MVLQDGGPVIDVVPPHGDVGRRVLRAYTADVASRYLGRPARADEVDASLGEDPSTDLAPPSGLFLVAREGGEVHGCVGLRLLPGRVGELKRLFVAPAARGRGLGRRLVGEVERHARERGVALLRLDTRADLVEARTLYGALGYREVAPFNRGTYAEHWYAKELL